MRINALGNTANDFASDDYIAIDGSTNGSRKMAKNTLLEKTAKSTYNAILLERAANENGAYKEFTAVAGSPVIIVINVNLKAGDKVLIRVDGNDGIISNNDMNISLYDNGVTVQSFGVLVKDFGVWYEIEANTNADSIIAQRDSAIGNGDLKFSAIPEKTLYNYLTGEIGDLETKVFGKVYTNNVDLTSVTSGYYYNATGVLVADSGSSYKEITLDSSFNDKRLTINVGTSTASGADTRYYVLMRGGSVIRAINNGIIKRDYDCYFTFPEKAQMGDVLRCSWKTSNGKPSIYTVVQKIPSIYESIVDVYTMYVSDDGDDVNGDGSKENPLKTITKAVESGAETIIVSSGNYDDNILDLSKSIHDKITIKGVRGEKAIFRKTDSLLLNDGSETLVSGYSNVYEATISKAPNYTGTTQWLFFDGLDDVTTAISTSDAHPLERGQFYRNNCTKLERTTANTLAEAIAEIEAATTYKWWYDSDTQKLYFNRAATTATYPIYRSYGTYLKTRENQSVVISNIEFRYGIVNLEKLNIVELYDVASKCVYGAGCFVYDDSIAVLFDHCEACLAFTGSGNGDGFNGHATAGVNQLAKYCQATLRECWSHDNSDDGYSDHEYAEATIDGGLYEWNKKGGVTPSYGSHCVCKNVLARHNYNGFYYTGTASEGNAGQMICYNCISESNNRGNATNSGGFKVDGDNNYIKLIGCRSIGDMHGAVGWSATAVVELIDFGYKDPIGSVTTGTSTLVKNNTTIYT